MSAGVASETGRHVGRPMRRKEDPRMITGRGRYIDDITVPGTGQALFYLVRGRNSCGFGSAGITSSGTPINVRSCP